MKFSERARTELVSLRRPRRSTRRFDPQRLDAPSSSTGFNDDGRVDARIATGWDAYAPLSGEVAIDTDETDLDGVVLARHRRAEGQARRPHHARRHARATAARRPRAPDRLQHRTAGAGDHAARRRRAPGRAARRHRAHRRAACAPAKARSASTARSAGAATTRRWCSTLRGDNVLVVRHARPARGRRSRRARCATPRGSRSRSPAR